MSCTDLVFVIISHDHYLPFWEGFHYNAGRRTHIIFNVVPNIHHLKQLTQGLTENQQRALRPLFEPAEFPCGKTIFRQGEAADSIFILCEGRVSIRFKPEDGPATDITEIVPGEVFGWSAALGRDVYTSSAISMVDCILYRINCYQLARFCEQNRVLGELIIDRLAISIAERMTSMQSFIRPLLDHGIDVRSENTPGDSKK